MEFPNVNSLLAQALKSLVYEHFAMALIVEELHHIDDDLGLYGLEMFLQLLN